MCPPLVGAGGTPAPMSPHPSAGQRRSRITPSRCDMWVGETLGVAAPGRAGAATFVPSRLGCEGGRAPRSSLRDQVVPGIWTADGVAPADRRHLVIPRLVRTREFSVPERSYLGRSIDVNHPFSQLA